MSTMDTRTLKRFKKAADKATIARLKRDHLTYDTIPDLIRKLWDMGATETEIVRATGFARMTVRKYKPTEGEDK